MIDEGTFIVIILIVISFLWILTEIKETGEDIKNQLREMIPPIQDNTGANKVSTSDDQISSNSSERLVHIIDINDFYPVLDLSKINRKGEELKCDAISRIIKDRYMSMPEDRRKHADDIMDAYLTSLGVRITPVTEQNDDKNKI